MSKAVVTGASGYVGGRLVHRLLREGYEAHIVVRHPDRVAGAPWADQVHVHVGDAKNPEVMGPALQDAAVAYYLMHSLGEGSGLEAEEAQVAHVFATCAKQANVGRIVYLGGLAPHIDETGTNPDASAHMRSRARVGQILRSSGVPTCELRAGVIIGSGSASFEMLRYLTERLPVMVTPRWVRSRIQPIAVGDVLHYLVQAAHLPDEVNRSFDIGGPDVMTYEQMMRAYAQVAGVGRRVILPINVLTPSLSSRWVGTITPVSGRIARPLVESLRHDAVCTENDIDLYLPEPAGGKTTFQEAVKKALARIHNGQVSTRWANASVPGAPEARMPTDPGWAGGHVYRDIRSTTTTATPQQVWKVIEGIGGENGYYSTKLLWRARGAIDVLVGGVGLRRGRRDPHRVRVGDTVDFWRVEEREEGALLRLRAEMRMPGWAWLELRISVQDGHTVVTQEAIFYPRGTSGYAYWYAVAPFHRFVFPSMLAHIVQAAEEDDNPEQGRPAQPAGEQAETATDETVQVEAAGEEVDREAVPA